MSTIIVLDGAVAVAAAELVHLAPEFGVLNFEGYDELGEPFGGERCLYINDSMTCEEVEELPTPWVPGAYLFRDGAFVCVEESAAWLSYLQERARRFEQLVKQYDGHVQERIDVVAQSFGYGDPNRPAVSPILHAITYADEPAVPKFQAEGRLLRAWRSRYWAATWPILEAVRAGERPVPEPVDLLAELDVAAPPPTADEVVDEAARLSANS